MIGPLWLEIAVALFAVIGLWCSLSLVLELLLPCEQVTLAVRVQHKKDADMLDMLLHEAGSAFLRRGRTRLVVLISSSLMDGTVGEGEELFEPYAEMIEAFGAECYLID